ncbi:retron St85 family effector protein [uncultured Vibrio sp.]|uniref:retron St85 family effector protein n=1 Tax=uncultured Vibrio sp. TaxID=114054 RepID=UPI002AABB6BF|nr:retron St85 family effector protein [uncultured Vibrio sp.]
MSSAAQDDYQKKIGDLFKRLDLQTFVVNLHPRITFLCGGPIQGSDTAFPSSLRERILNHLNEHHDDIEKNTVVAESFSDYFQNGQYKNLLQFEEDIANIASLIVVCLESAGSLVEFGLFCNHPSSSTKLLVYIPEDHYEEVNSFITLGPLAQLQSTAVNSVASYPFPDSQRYQYEHIDMVVDDLLSRLDNSPKTERFDINNSGHLAFLIHDVISLCAPIKKQEIAMSLSYMGINCVSDKRLSSLLYLLSKVKLIGKKTYSYVDYFYPLSLSLQKVTIGKFNDSSNFDRNAKLAEIKMTFMMNPDKQEQTLKKRRLVWTKITESLGE